MPSPHDVPELLRRFQEAAAEQDFQEEWISQELSIPAFTREGEGPIVLLSAGIHGDEPASPLAALNFLKSGPARDFRWLITPLLNPTGIALGTRESAAGLDLNRDYHEPASPEIQAHCEWLTRQPVPDLFISLHEDYDATGFYYYEIELAGRPSLKDEIFARLPRILPLEPGPLIDGRESDGPGWFFRRDLPDLSEFVSEEGGYPEALHLSNAGCSLSLTFETPTHAAPLATRISAHLAAIEAVLSQFSKI